jgi:hypothetical protein
MLVPEPWQQVVVLVEPSLPGWCRDDLTAVWCRGVFTDV